MTRNMGKVFVRQAPRIECEDIFAVLVFAVEQIRKIERVRLIVRIKGCAYRRIDLDGSVAEIDSFFLVIQAFSDGNFRCDLQSRPLVAADASEGINGGIVLHFGETCAVPLPLSIEKSDILPLTRIPDEFSASDRPGRLENVVQVGVAEPSKQTLELIKKLGAVSLLLRRWHLTFTLCVPRCHRRYSSNEHRQQHSGHRSSHGY